MNICIRRLILIGILIMTLFGTSACMVEGYKEFQIEGFEEFFELDEAEQEKYINSGKLDFSKIQDVALIPFIKEINETECIALLFPYSRNENAKMMIDKVTLLTSEGDVILETENYGEIDVFSKMDDQMVCIDTFEKSEKWFQNARHLVLKINARTLDGHSEQEKELSYNITIVGYWGPSWQV